MGLKFVGINNLTLDNYKPLRDIVFENIREAIMEGTLRPGERLMEIQLAEQLGVSRTPVREAIRKLELEGLVVMLPRKGAYVASISKKDLVEILELRVGLKDWQLFMQLREYLVKVLKIWKKYLKTWKTMYIKMILQIC